MEVCTSLFRYLEVNNNVLGLFKTKIRRYLVFRTEKRSIILTGFTLDKVSIFFWVFMNSEWKWKFISPWEENKRLSSPLYDFSVSTTLHWLMITFLLSFRFDLRAACYKLLSFRVWTKYKVSNCWKNCCHIRISGPPVEVGVTMYVLSISSLSEVKMVLKGLRTFLF